MDKHVEQIIKKAQAAVAKHKNGGKEAQAIRVQMQEHIDALHALIAPYGFANDIAETLDQVSAQADEWLGGLPEEGKVSAQDDEQSLAGTRE